MATPGRPIPDPRGRLVSGNAAGRVGNLESIEFGPLVRGLGAAAAAAQSVAQEAEENERMADRLRLAKAASEFQIEVSKRLDALDPLSPTYETDARQAAEEARSAILERTVFSFQDTGQRFDIETTAGIEQAVIGAARLRRQALHKKAEVDWKDHEARLLNEIISNPTAAEAVIEKHRASTEALLASMDPTRRSAFEAALKDGAVLSVAEGLARNGRFQEAIRFLRSDAASGVDPDVLIGAERRVIEQENRARQEQLRATAGLVEEIEFKIRTGQATEQDIAAATAKGVYANRPGLQSSHRFMLLEHQRKKEEQEKKVTDKVEKLNNRDPGGYPSSQNEADDIWKARHGGIEDPNERLKMAVAFSVQTGYLPNEYRRTIKAAETVNDPEYLAAMARLDATIREGNPMADTGSGDRILAVQDLAAVYGGDFARAAKDVIDRNINSKTVNRRNTEVAEAIKAVPAEAWSTLAEREFGSTDPRLVNMLQDRAKRLFLILDDMSQAMRLSAVAIAREGWGTTRVGKGKGLQQYAPERLMPPLARVLPPNLVTEVIDDDVTSLLGQLGIQLPDTLPSWVERDTPLYRLVVDKEGKGDTVGDVRPRLEVLNVYGIYEPIRLADGSFVRWRPPNDGELRANPKVAELLRTADTVAAEMHALARGSDARRETWEKGREPIWRRAARNVKIDMMLEKALPDKTVVIGESDMDEALADELEERGFKPALVSDAAAELVRKYADGGVIRAPDAALDDLGVIDELEELGFKFERR